MRFSTRIHSSAESDISENTGLFIDLKGCVACSVTPVVIEVQLSCLIKCATVVLRMLQVHKIERERKDFKVEWNLFFC